MGMRKWEGVFREAKGGGSGFWELLGAVGS